MFQKGHKKLGGKKKGTKHHATVFIERIKELGIDLIGDAFRDLELVEDAGERVELRIKLMRFAYPEMKGDVTLTVTQNNALKDLSDEKLKYMVAAGVES